MWKKLITFLGENRICYKMNEDTPSKTVYVAVCIFMYLSQSSVRDLLKSVQTSLFFFHLSYGILSGAVPRLCQSANFDVFFVIKRLFKKE